MIQFISLNTFIGQHHNLKFERTVCETACINILCCKIHINLTSLLFYGSRIECLRFNGRSDNVKRPTTHIIPFSLKKNWAWISVWFQFVIFAWYFKCDQYSGVFATIQFRNWEICGVQTHWVNPIFFHEFLNYWKIWSNMIKEAEMAFGFAKRPTAEGSTRARLRILHVSS